MLQKVINYFSKKFKGYCYIHRRRLEVWSHGRNKHEYQLGTKLVECPDCYPELTYKGEII